MTMVFQRPESLKIKKSVLKSPILERIFGCHCHYLSPFDKAFHTVYTG